MFQQQQLSEFAAALKLQGKQKHTVDSYTRDVKGFAEFLASQKVEKRQLEPSYLVFYQNELLKNKSGGNSIRRGVIGVRQYFRFLVEADYMPMSPFDHVAIPPRVDKALQVLEDDDIDSLFHGAKDARSMLKVTRDHVILSLLAYEGLKASELISLKRDAFLVHKNLSSLRIDGPKCRVIALSPYTTKHVEAYLEELKELATQVGEYLIVAFCGKDLEEILPKISRHGLKFSLYEVGHRAGIAGLNTELLRHYAISRFLHLGFTPPQIMQHLGLRRMGNIGKHLHVLEMTAGYGEAHA